jgi:hypothetical protein
MALAGNPPGDQLVPHGFDTAQACLAVDDYASQTIGVTRKLQLCAGVVAMDCGDPIEHRGVVAVHLWLAPIEEDHEAVRCRRRVILGR